MVASAARRQIVGGGGGGAPTQKNRRRRRKENVGGGGAARPAHSSTFNYNITRIVLCERVYSVAGHSLRASVSLHVSLSSGQLLLSFRAQLSGLQLLTHAMHTMLRFLP